MNKYEKEMLEEFKLYGGYFKDGKAYNKLGEEVDYYAPQSITNNKSGRNHEPNWNNANYDGWGL